MHKYLLLLAAATLALPAQAQTERGAKLLGVSVGNITYNNYRDSDNAFSAAVYPSVGWFVVDRLAVGTGVNLSYDRSRSSLVGIDGPVVRTGRTWGYGLAPFARYYFVNAEKHKLFVQASGDVTRYSIRSKIKENGQTNQGGSYSETDFGWAAGVGYNYFVSPNVALETTVGYRRANEASYVGAPAQGSLDVRLGFSVFLLSGQGLKGN